MSEWSDIVASGKKNPTAALIDEVVDITETRHKLRCKMGLFTRFRVWSDVTFVLSAVMGLLHLVFSMKAMYAGVIGTLFFLTACSFVGLARWQRKRIDEIEERYLTRKQD